MDKPKKTREAPTNRNALFVEGITEDTRLQFKSACALHGKTMKAALILLMRGYTEGKIKLGR